MLNQLRIAVTLFLLLTLVTGVVYPLVITGIAQVVFPHAANGSVIERAGRAIGSELIGQPFDDPRYFWPRPSATGPTSYNAAASTGSNYGPTNPAQLEAVRTRAKVLRAAHGASDRPVPIDLVTASGSGLDPHITPAAADYQVSRVGAARNLDEQVIRKLIEETTEGRQLGVLGEPRINVLILNLELDRASQQ